MSIEIAHFLTLKKTPKENHSSNFGHSGAQTGASTQLMIIPSKGVVVAVMSNTSGAYGEVAGLSVDLIEIMKIGKREKQ